MEKICKEKEDTNYGCKDVRRKSRNYYGSKLWDGLDHGRIVCGEGTKVVLTARDKEKLDKVVERIREKGGNSIGVVADSCSTEDTKRVM